MLQLFCNAGPRHIRTMRERGQLKMIMDAENPTSINFKMSDVLELRRKGGYK